MPLYGFLSSAPESSEAVASAGGTHPIFWVIVGLVALGMVVMVLQNFVFRKEEYYK